MALPTKIELLNYGLSDPAKDILKIMLNDSTKDYSTVYELSRDNDLQKYDYEKILGSVLELNARGFLIEVRKPYGSVYAVNKLRISNMLFKYE